MLFRSCLLATLLCLLLPVVSAAFSGSPPAGRSGDPGATTCQAGCHPSFPLDSGDVTLTLSDATNPVTAYAITTTHADDMLMVHVGDFVFESDLYNPGNGGAAFSIAQAQELLDAINGSGMSTAGLQIVGGHGGVAPLSELETFLSP